MSAHRSIICHIVVLPLFGLLAYSHYSPYTCQIQSVSVKQTNRCNWPKVSRHGTVQLWLQMLLEPF